MDPLLTLSSACGKQFPGVKHLKKHMKDVHDEKSLLESIQYNKTNEESPLFTSVVRRLGTQSHLKKSKFSHVSFNSKRAGYSPSRKMTLRAKSTPLSSPNSPNINNYME